MRIPLARPDLIETDCSAILEVLKTPILTLGPKVDEFEEKIAHYTGSRYAVATNSGTSALHLIIKSLGIGEGDQVITTPFSFIASANCVLFERATPVFVDIEDKTLNIDVNKIEGKITGKTRAILGVDVFGHPADWDELQKVAKESSLKLIEDSAEAVGAEYKGAKAGNFGNAAVFAFYPNKQITTGEGGVIVTSDEKMAKLCRSMRNQGRGEGDDWLQHERLGYNYRISDINCALGIAQLERLDEILEKRETVAQMYNERLKDTEGVRIPYVAPQVKMSWFVYVIRLDDSYTKEDRDGVLQELEKRRIGCSNYFPPIHLQPFYRKMFGYREGDFPVTERVSKSTVALPFYNNLTEKLVDHVCQNLKEVLGEIK